MSYGAGDVIGIVAGIARIPFAGIGVSEIEILGDNSQKSP